MARLTIRDEQWRAFELDAERRFEDRLVETMTRAWPEVSRDLGAEGTRARVRLAAERARCHGLLAQEQITRFVHLAFLAGEGFDRRPPFATILAWGEPPERAIDLLERAAQGEQEGGARSGGS